MDGPAGTPAGPPVAVQLPAGDGLLERRAGAEARRLRRLDLDRLARLRIARGARGPLADAELAEPGQRDVVALLERLRDVLGDRVERGPGLGLAEAGVLRDRLDELGLVQSQLPPG